jgi:alpha-beta hydrolase superfamily lysophospholipase
LIPAAYLYLPYELPRWLASDGDHWARWSNTLTAIDFVPQLGVPVGNTTVVAHSAGAYLAMWAAARSASTVDLHLALGPMLDIGATCDNDDVIAATATTSPCSTRAGPSGSGCWTVSGGCRADPPLARVCVFPGAFFSTVR